MEPGLRALLHANQPGLLPSFPPPACLPRSLLLAGRMASPALPGAPQQAAPRPAWVVTQRELQRDRAAGLAAPGGPGRLLAVSGRLQSSPLAPSWQEPVSALPARAGARGSPCGSRGLSGLTPRRPPGRGAAGLPRQRQSLPQPRPGRRGEGNAELCQLLMDSRGSAALSALHGS